MTAEMLAIVVGTFVSEDLTCIGTGLLIQEGLLSWPIGLFGCFLGIYFGDVGLWLLGRCMGRTVLQRPWIKKRISERTLETMGQWFDKRGWIAVLAARFLPGTRLLLYLAGGALGRKGGRFALWTFLAALLWTPLLVGLVALLGPGIVTPLQTWLGSGWLAFVAAAGIFLAMVRFALAITSVQGRVKLAKLWRWEFWPTWLFYLPALPWIGWLMLRYRSFTVWTSANPGIPGGGVVGESKFDILANLPERWIVPSALLTPGEWVDRAELLEELLHAKGWAWPMILKPDVGQRGAGLKLARNLAEATDYLKNQPDAIVVQTYHPGPFEAGIFYYRLPGESSGHIFSITDKQFPVLVGDGHSTLDQLIYAHPRFRMQAKTFLTRHQKEVDRVLGTGEAFRLAVAGNHCQGTLFRDGVHLFTPELEGRVDEIARHFDGFFFGRFDVRYTNVDAFKAGEDLAIVELNGVTSESTNIYDPSGLLLAAYRTLWRQWSLVFRISDANRLRGYGPTSLGSLLRLVAAHPFTKPVTVLAD